MESRDEALYVVSAVGFLHRRRTPFMVLHGFCLHLISSACMKLTTGSCVLMKEIDLGTFTLSLPEFVLWHQKWLVSAEQVELKGRSNPPEAYWLLCCRTSSVIEGRREETFVCFLFPVCDVTQNATCSSELIERLARQDWRSRFRSFFFSICVLVCTRVSSQMLPY